MLRRLAHSSCGALARRPPTASFAPAAAATATAGPRASAAAAAAPLSTSASASPTPTTPPTAAAEPLYKYLTPASMLEGRPPAVARALAIHNADAGEKKQAAKQARIAQFGLRPGDTGSTPVQGAWVGHGLCICICWWWEDWIMEGVRGGGA